MKKALTLICTLTLLACGHDNAQTATVSSADQPTTESATIAEGAFKMYEQARVQPEDFCDLYTLLRITNNESGAVATLSNELSGYCEIAVIENLRSYKLAPVETSCGSVIYKGTLDKPSTSKHIADTIELTDHRTRTCRDVVPAKIILKQIFSEDKVSTLFSHDHAAITVTMKGSLVHIVAIGGESTGFGLQLSNGDIIEIALESNDLITSFEEGKDVVITGTYRTVYGVEIPERQVLVVESMTAL